MDETGKINQFISQWVQQVAQHEDNWTLDVLAQPENHGFNFAAIHWGTPGHGPTFIGVGFFVPGDLMPCKIELYRHNESFAAAYKTRHLATCLTYPEQTGMCLCRIAADHTCNQLSACPPCRMDHR